MAGRHVLDAQGSQRGRRNDRGLARGGQRLGADHPRAPASGGESAEMSMSTALESATPADLGAAAAEIAGRYATVPARETEAALAILALWALDAVESGR